MSRQAVVITLLLTLACGVVFGLWPDLDLAVARLFHVEGAFAGTGLIARGLRAILYVLPGLVLAGAMALWALRRLPGRAVAFLVLSMALGPGLLTNLILKDHWHRPRPVQTTEFGGPHPFRPWYKSDGGCEKNCSFVSGEASAAAWLMGPASLAPPQVRAAAMAGALTLALLTGGARMAFGGHYLSDVLFAILLTLLVTEGLARLLLPSPPKGEPPAA